MNSEKTSAFTTYNPTALQNLRAVNKPHKPDNVKTQHTKKSNSDFFITLDSQVLKFILLTSIQPFLAYLNYFLKDFPSYRSL